MLSRQEYRYIVSVIIPNWNGEHLLKLCLPSLKKQTFKDFEIIVVDNGSGDGSIDYIKKYHQKVVVLPLDKNYGFAAAVNAGIKKGKGRFLVLLNNDTEVDKDYLFFLVKSAEEQKQAGFIAPKMLNFYKRDLIDSAGDTIDVVGHPYNIGMHQKDGDKFSKPREVFMVTAGGGLFKKEVFDKVGLFDEDYFTYMEDVDLCLRAQLQGFRGWYEPRSIAYHIHKATSNRIKPLMEYWQFRNMTQNIIKNYPAALFKKNLNWLKIILVNLNTVRFLAIHGYLWQGLKAEIYILLNLPKLLKKRSEIQSKKTVADDYFISNFIEKRITFFGLLKKGI
ncbi:glycosyltransferase family 2 protein [Candidatus Daviesbacteria bacterium]|nr:glycosyltransferase family 2 protein [Candidatus Daviesbacteria bacterium]